MKIISIQRNSQHLDVDREFAHYKFAIPEHEPIKLSNDLWLHSYRVTKYNESPCFADPDTEQDSFENEMYG